MKKTYILLIIGSGLIVSGLTVGAYTISLIEKSDLSQFPVNETEVPLTPGANYTQSISARSGERFAIVVSYEPPDVPVTAQVQDSTGRIIVQFDVAQTLSQFAANTDGNHFVIVINEGSEPVMASLSVISLGVFSDESFEFSPFLNDIFSFLGFVALSGVLFLAGIILLIIGGIKYVREKRKERV